MDKEPDNNTKTAKQKKIQKKILEICGRGNKKSERTAIKIVGYIREYLGITIGTFIMAIGIALFMLPNELSTGGFSGISTIAYYLFKFPLGNTILILNIPLFILAYFKIGKRLFFRSIYGTISFSFFVDLLDQFFPFTHDRLLASIYGGILAGIGTAVVLKLTGSTGGSDLLSYVIKSYKPQYRTSNLILIIDFIVIGLNVLFFKKIEIGLYSAISIYLMGKMIDIIFEGANFAKMLLIISPKYEEIANVIGKNIKRGSTGLYSKGMYKNDNKMTLLCVGSRTEAYLMETVAKKIDKTAFIIIINAREVLGKGFK